MTNKPLFPNLAAEMAKHGHGLKEIAELLDISVPAASRRLNGQIEFTQSEIDKLCKCYDKPYEVLFNYEIT